MEGLFGLWWLCIWRTKNREINIGIGEDLGEGDFGPFFIINKRFGPFWISISKPTLAFINGTIKKKKH
jgi:hypothetical protein